MEKLNVSSTHLDVEITAIAAPGISSAFDTVTNAVMIKSTVPRNFYFMDVCLPRREFLHESWGPGSIAIMVMFFRMKPA
jgi:hypothetical protein